MALERTAQYQGLYHVLGGLISPMDGIGPSQLSIEPLLTRVAEGTCTEVILALSATLEGDQTAFYLARRLSQLASAPALTHIARGIPVGGELEFADELTLARSLVQRTPYVNPLTSESAT
jgi:recombination protein RecR